MGGVIGVMKCLPCLTSLKSFLYRVLFMSNFYAYISPFEYRMFPFYRYPTDLYGVVDAARLPFVVPVIGTAKERRAADRRLCLFMFMEAVHRSYLTLATSILGSTRTNLNESNIFVKLNMQKCMISTRKNGTVDAILKTI